jgi:hypothetical protein
MVSRLFDDGTPVRPESSVSEPEEIGGNRTALGPESGICAAAATRPQIGHMRLG